MIVRELLIAIGVKFNDKELDKVEKGVKRTRGEVKKLSASTNTLARDARRMVGAFMGFQAINSLARKMVGTITTFERLRAQLVTIEQDEAKAEKAFARLQDFAVKTPFQLSNVVKSFSFLRAVGINPTNEDMTAMGDVAAGMGKDISEFAQAVVGATTGETERLKAFGIVMRLQGKKAEINFKGRKIKIKRDAKAISQALFKLGRENFAGGMTRQMNTISGSFSNLQDNIAKFFNAIGKAGLSAALVELIKELTGGVGEAGDLAKILGGVLTAGVKGLTVAVKFLKANWKTFSAIITAFIALKAVLVLGAMGTAMGGLSLATLAAVAAMVKLKAATALVGIKILAAVAAVALLFLAVDDLLGFLEGKESVIGIFLEEMFDIKGPLAFAKVIEENRIILQGLVVALGGLLAVIGGPVTAAIGIFTALAAGVWLIYENWDIVLSSIVKGAEIIALALALAFGPVGVAIGLFLILAKHWDFVVIFMEEMWKGFVDLFWGTLQDLMEGIKSLPQEAAKAIKQIPGIETAISAAGDLFGSGGGPAEPLVPSLLGPGAASPSLDARRRDQEVRNNQTQQDIRVNAPITLNPPPGADTDDIMEELERKFAGVMTKATTRAASNLEGGVD